MIFYLTTKPQRARSPDEANKSVQNHPAFQLSVLFVPLWLKSPSFPSPGDERSPNQKSEGELEQEGRLGRFVPEEDDAQQSAGPTADRARPQKRGLRDAAGAAASSAPFVETEQEKSPGAEKAHPREQKLVDGFHG